MAWGRLRPEADGQVTSLANTPEFLGQCRAARRRKLEPVVFALYRPRNRASCPVHVPPRPSPRAVVAQFPNHFPAVWAQHDNGSAELPVRYRRRCSEMSGRQAVDTC